MKHFIAAIVLFLFIPSCRTLHDSEEDNISLSVEGVWYSESTNEEVSFSDGFFASTAVNYYLFEHIRGFYKVESSVLTEQIINNGQLIERIWNVAVTGSTLELKSSVEKLLFHKVEKDLTIGIYDTVYCSEVIVGNKYKSLDERILKTKDGLLYACGNKGMTFIEVGDGDEKYYIKVYVDVPEDFYDCWYDYSKLLGCSYEELKSVVGIPSYRENDRAVHYYGLDSISNGGIKEVSYFFKNEVVWYILVDLTSEKNDNDILAYLRQKYHQGEKIDRSFYHFNYPNVDDMDLDKEDFYMVIYDPEEKRIYYQKHNPKQ